MDPLSIAASCFGLVAAITKVSITVTKFVRQVRDARGDLDYISRELQSLTMVLELLGDDIAKPTNTSLPANLLAQVKGIIENCNGVVTDIDTTLVKHETSRLGHAGHWNLGGGKDDMAKFRCSLEAHKLALELALDMVTITIARDIKRDTEQIRNDTAAIPDIKNDTTQILEEIARLKARLPPDNALGGHNLTLQRFLDESTTYAETVCNDPAEDRTDAAAPPVDAGDQLRPLIHANKILAKSPQRTLAASSTLVPPSANVTCPQLPGEGLMKRNIVAGRVVPGFIKDELGLSGRKHVTWQHELRHGNQVMTLDEAEYNTHWYTPVSCALSELAQQGFKLRQRILEPPRETTLLITILFLKDDVYGNEFSPDISTTLESVMESILHASSNTVQKVDWSRAVVVCVIHASAHHKNPDTSILSKSSVSSGMEVHCSTNSCGFDQSPKEGEDNQEIHARIWEHTTDKTSITYSDRGWPSAKTGPHRLQMVECLYTRLEDVKAMTVEDHLTPFVQMLKARSCVYVTAGDRIDKSDVLEAVYLLQQPDQNWDPLPRDIQDELSRKCHGEVWNKCSGVLTRVYRQSKAGQKLEPERRSLRSRFISRFKKEVRRAEARTSW